MATATQAALQPAWTVKTSSFALWALAVLCVLYWVLKFVGAPTGAVSAPPALRAPAPVDTAAVARLLGGAAAAEAAAPVPALASRFVLQGIVADRRGAGAALIAVDGKPARPVRVGAVVGEGLVLQSLQGRRALLGPTQEGPTAVALELPEKARGAQGPVPAAQGPAMPGAAMTSPAMPGAAGGGLPATVLGAPGTGNAGAAGR